MLVLFATVVLYKRIFLETFQLLLYVNVLLILLFYFCVLLYF